VFQKLMALLISGAVVSGAGLFASAEMVLAASAVSSKPAQASEAKSAEGARNTAPLPVGRAAGIQQAQAATTGGNDWILIGGGLAAGALILVLVAGGGDEDAPSSTGTN
jgi:hypothetical protein